MFARGLECSGNFMGVVRYRCPNTEDEVSTAIETRNDVLFKIRSMDLKIWVWCPHCMAGHSIGPKDAIPAT